LSSNARAFFYAAAESLLDRSLGPSSQPFEGHFYLGFFELAFFERAFAALRFNAFCFSFL
jgi:hypothetical protein